MLSRRLAVGTFLCCLLACGKIPEADDSTDDQPSDIDAGLDGGSAEACDQEQFGTEAFIECYSKLNCELIVSCDYLFADVADCLVYFEQGEARSGLQRLRDAIDADRTEINQAQFKACIVAWEAQIASGICDFRQPVECIDIFSGQLLGEDVCFDDFECAGSGSSCQACDGAQQCCPGTCVAGAAEGAACIDDEQPCQTGLHCVAIGGQAENSTCQDGEAGAPCVANYNCDEDFFCSAGACVADVIDDRACESSDACLAPLVCVQGTCQHAYEGDDCDRECEFGFFCEVPPAGGIGTCRPIGIAVGDACFGSCLKDLICVEGKCAERRGEGAACQSGQCELGLFCSSELSSGGGEPVAGECLAPQADGEPCRDSYQCASGVCEGDPARVCTTYQSCE